MQVATLDQRTAEAEAREAEASTRAEEAERQLAEASTRAEEAEGQLTAAGSRAEEAEQAAAEARERGDAAQRQRTEAAALAEAHQAEAAAEAEQRVEVRLNRAQLVVPTESPHVYFNSSTVAMVTEVTFTSTLFIEALLFLMGHSIYTTAPQCASLD